MHEPDVTLTDYLLAIECLVFIVLLTRARVANARARWGSIVLFVGLAAAAALGGTSHGFFPWGSGFAADALWRVTLVAIGVAAWGGWALFAGSSFDPRLGRAIVAVAGLILVGYTYYVVVIDQAYLIAIVHYAPAVLALTLIFAIRAFQSRERAAWIGFVGLVLTFVAAGVQVAGIGLHPRYFNHNALYHVIQFVALVLVYRGARWLCDQPILFSRRMPAVAS